MGGWGKWKEGRGGRDETERKNASPVRVSADNIRVWPAARGFTTRIRVVKHFKRKTS